MIPVPPTEFVAIDRAPVMGSPSQVRRRSPEPRGPGQDGRDSTDHLSATEPVAQEGPGRPSVESGLVARSSRADRVVTMHDLLKLARGEKSQIVDTLDRRWIGATLSARIRRRFCPPGLRAGTLRPGTSIHAMSLELTTPARVLDDGLPITRYRAHLVVKDRPRGAA